MLTPQRMRTTALPANVGSRNHNHHKYTKFIHAQNKFGRRQRQECFQCDCSVEYTFANAIVIRRIDDRHSFVRFSSSFFRAELDAVFLHAHFLVLFIFVCVFFFLLHFEIAFSCNAAACAANAAAASNTQKLFCVCFFPFTEFMCNILQSCTGVRYRLNAGISH